MTETIDVRLTRIIDELLTGGIRLPEAMNHFELKFVRRAIEKAKGNITEASKKLGVHRNTLHNKVRLIDGPTPRARRQRALRRRRQGRG